MSKFVASGFVLFADHFRTKSNINEKKKEEEKVNFAIFQLKCRKLVKRSKNKLR